MTIQFNHGDNLGISSIWQQGSTFAWSNRCGEGCGLSSFEAAATEAEETLLSVSAYKVAETTLRLISAELTEQLVAHAVVCEFNCDDNTPTLHIDLWNGVDITDLPERVASLNVVAEGSWDGGRSYSLQIA